ncbi:hypothetical protein C8034_v007530 [Colletotrichum sidae]|uniref:Uncharacterized protein n=1 Tax=Colletotrichum sidae TaxID=1347389 RepID=A0A4R8T556_9PEZI|nr:hypothetical protein C8034_v007530 [Colletotrichum sidae]
MSALSSATHKFDYPVDDLNCLSDSECRSRKLTQERLAFNTTYLDENIFANRSVVTRMFTKTGNDSSVVFLRGHVPETGPDNTTGTDFLIYICSMIGAWVPSNLTIDPRISDVLQSSFLPGNMRDLYNEKIPMNLKHIKFNDEWLDTLNPRWNITGDTWATPLSSIVKDFSRRDSRNGSIHYLFAPTEPGNYSAAEVFLAKTFGVFLTEGLARADFGRATLLVKNVTESEVNYIDLNRRYGAKNGNRKISKLQSTEATLKIGQGEEEPLNRTFGEVLADIKAALHIGLHAEQYGYGTGEKRRTLTFAQALMCIYLGTLVLYAASVAVGFAVGVPRPGIRG